MGMALLAVEVTFCFYIIKKNMNPIHFRELLTTGYARVSQENSSALPIMAVWVGTSTDICLHI
jgi:hypothetical protein